MKKFNVGDEVTAKLPSIMGGKEVKGIVLLNDLKGPHPVLAKLFANGGELCVQTDDDGSDTLFPVKKDTGTAVVSYIFDDGTATPFKSADVPAKHTRAAIGVMKARAGTDGKYSGHEFVSLIGTDDAEEKVIDGSIGFKEIGLTELPKEVRDVLDDLFRRPKR